jgi:serine/threonine protein kinase
MTQISLAILHLHSRDIMHRNVKPSNIWIDQEENAFLRGFYLPINADFADDEWVGNPLFMAPERLMLDQIYSSNVDVWSLGITFYEALTQKRPEITMSNFEEEPIDY